MTPFSPPIGNQSLRGCGHPGPQEFPHPVMVLEEGSVHFSLLAFWDPPLQPGTHGPPPQPIYISKKIHSICFRFIYTSTRHGGAECRTPRLRAPSPHRGAGEHVSKGAHPSRLWSS